jgi:hypothetical protein
VPISPTGLPLNPRYQPGNGQTLCLLSHADTLQWIRLHFEHHTRIVISYCFSINFNHYSRFVSGGAVEDNWDFVPIYDPSAQTGKSS